MCVCDVFHHCSCGLSCWQLYPSPVRLRLISLLFPLPASHSLISLISVRIIWDSQGNWSCAAYCVSQSLAILFSQHHPVKVRNVIYSVLRSFLPALIKGNMKFQCGNNIQQEKMWSGTWSIKLTDLCKLEKQEKELHTRTEGFVMSARRRVLIKYFPYFNKRLQQPGFLYTFLFFYLTCTEIIKHNKTEDVTEVNLTLWWFQDYVVWC